MHLPVKISNFLVAPPPNRCPWDGYGETTVLVSVTALGARADRTRAAARDIVNYLEGAAADRAGSKGSQTPAMKASGPGTYYSDAPERPGIWRGAGTSEFGEAVDSQTFTRALLGKDPLTGVQLVTAAGSSARSGKTMQTRVEGDPQQRLSLPEAAEIIGVHRTYLWRLAKRTAESREMAISRSSEGPSSGGFSSPDSSPGSSPAPRSGAFLDAMKVDGRWMVDRAEVARFVADREVPQVVMAYDITFSAPKSLSILWATGDAEVKGLCEEAFEAGVARGVRYLEEHAIAVGRGAGQKQASGMVAASYRHTTNRELEPQLHEHVVIANMAKGPDGMTRAVDSKGLFSHATTAGYLAEAEMQAVCNRRGIAWTPTHRGIANVEGVSPEAIRAMSTRREQILSLTSEMGTDSTKARQTAALMTRAAKDQPVDQASLRQRWVERLAEVGFGPDQLAAATSADPARLWTPQDSARLYRHLAGPEGVTEQQATFDRRDVIQKIVDHAGGRLAADEVEAHADRWLASIDAIPVSDIESSPVGLGGVRYTTPAMVRIETAISDAYATGVDSQAAVVPDHLVDAAIERWETSTGHTLGDDQVAMVRAICGSGDRFQAVVGPAGSGKTAALEVAARAWESAGYEVLGAAVNGTAAEVLERSTGVKSRTVAGLVTRLDTATSPVIGDRTVVIVDEASTLGNRHHARLTHHIQQSGAAMRAIGDPAQHSAVEAGGMWARMVTEHAARTPVLTENRRQTAPQMAEVRLANADYRAGRIADAVARLEDNDRIVTASTSVELLDQLAADWYVDRQTYPDRESKMIAEHHHERRALNTRAQALLKADGTIEGNGVAIGEATFHVGDQVISRRANRALHAEGDPKNHVRNGTPGTVVDVKGRPGKERIIVDFKDRGPITVDRDWLTAEIRPGIVGGLTPAYAVTSHAAQGDTYAAGRMVATDTSKAEAVYVGLTRGSHDTRIYTVTADPPIVETDPKLPRVLDRRDHIEALSDQLSRPKPIETATAQARDLADIAALLERPLAELETSADPTAATAAQILAQRITHQARTEPDPALVAVIGTRGRHPDPELWDQAVDQRALTLARGGVDPLNPAVSLPGESEAREAIRAAEASRLSQTPTAELAARRREHASRLGGLNPREPQWARNDYNHTKSRLAAAERHHSAAQHAYDAAVGAKRRHRDPDRIESARRTLAASANKVDQARHNVDLARSRLENTKDPRSDIARLESRIEIIDQALQPRITAAVEHPADYLTETLGPRPGKNPQRWDRAAKAIETYRHTALGVEPAKGALGAVNPSIGPRPASGPDLGLWRTAMGMISKVDHGIAAQQQGISQR